MEDEASSMAERILTKLCTILKDDVALQEFSIIPCPENAHNRSPVHHEDHNLGLESWSVKYVYNLAYTSLIKARPLVNEAHSMFSNADNVLIYLNTALLIHPDVTTFWNMRRNLVQAKVLSIPNELHFTNLTLTHKPKCNESYAYRRWLITRILNDTESSINNCDERILQQELDVCKFAAYRCCNNYHAWTHRIWCLQNMMVRNNWSKRAIEACILKELLFSSSFVRNHITDYCGYHYRQYLLQYTFKHGLCKGALSILPASIANQLQVSHIMDKTDNEDARTIRFLFQLFGKPPSTQLCIIKAHRMVDLICGLISDSVHILDFIDQGYGFQEAAYYHRRFILYKTVELMHLYLDVELGEFTVDSAEMDCLNSDSQPKSAETKPNFVHIISKICSGLYTKPSRTPLFSLSPSSSDKCKSIDDQRQIMERFHKWRHIVLTTMCENVIE